MAVSDSVESVPRTPCTRVGPDRGPLHRSRGWVGALLAECQKRHWDQRTSSGDRQHPARSVVSTDHARAFRHDLG
eukprot:scaffold58982_cov59-Phaeocystis_antarctica.AAC.2